MDEQPAQQQPDLTAAHPSPKRPAAVTGAGVLLILLALWTACIKPGILTAAANAASTRYAIVIWLCAIIAATTYLLFAVALLWKRRWAMQYALQLLLFGLCLSLYLAVGLHYALPAEAKDYERLEAFFSAFAGDLVPTLVVSVVIFYLMKRANLMAAYEGKTPQRGVRDVPVSVAMIATLHLLYAAEILLFGLICYAQAKFTTPLSPMDAYGSALFEFLSYPCYAIAGILGSVGIGLLRLSPAARIGAIISSTCLCVGTFFLFQWLVISSVFDGNFRSDYLTEALLFCGGVYLMGIAMLCMPKVIKAFEQ